ncbi:MAG: magnesium-translocating P-type ATPase [Terricaulis sp.]
MAGEEPTIAYWNVESRAVLARLSTSEDGLSSSEAAARLAHDGPNALEQMNEGNAWRLLLRQFESPLVLILVFGAAVAFTLRDWTEGAIILLIVLGSTALGFIQEFHASRAIAALRARLALNVRVVRDGGERTVPAAELVAGDIVILSAGNLVPADGLILKSTDFLVTEASLTGESFPVEKRAGEVARDAPLPERTNCAFAGSSVRSGTARVVVVETGRRTQFGVVAARLQARAVETEFQRGLRRFGYLLLRVMVVLVGFVLVINQLLGRPFFESLLFSVALAVGMSPELLPAIVSVTLSAGARAMAKRGVLVRRLDAIENLGEVDVLCTDKTGTLTEGAVALAGALDIAGAPSEAVLRYAYANAAFETGIENPLDKAICDACRAKDVDIAGLRKVDEIPYDFQRKRLLIAVDEGDPSTRLLIVKGAFDQVLGVCAAAQGGDGKGAPMTDTFRADLNARYAAFGNRGLRTLALAIKHVARKDDYTHADERDLTLIGFLTFADPPKPDASATLKAMAEAGIALKIITGDNRHVAASVAAAMGIDTSAVLAGKEIAAMKDAALTYHAERTALFAEVDPQQKERIVRALQKGGHAVAFLGDGVNDAPSLHAADVGISVDGAVDVAREAADVILLERNLGVLLQAVEDGRRTFANTVKYISITTGSSFGNMVSMALATALLPFLPMTATQILLTNFLTDLPLMAVTADSVDSEQVLCPLRWRVRDIQSFMLVFGLVSSGFDLISFLMLRNIFHVDEATFQTTWFIISVLTEIVALLTLRTRRRAWQSQPGRWILVLSACVTAFVLAAPFMPGLAPALHLRPLPAGLLALALTIPLVYGVATEAAKAWYYRRFDSGAAPMASRSESSAQAAR